jgi:hypothetical protein
MSAANGRDFIKRANCSERRATIVDFSYVGCGIRTVVEKLSWRRSPGALRFFGVKFLGQRRDVRLDDLVAGG